MAASGEALGTLIFTLVRFREPDHMAIGPYEVPGAVIRDSRIGGVGLHVFDSGYLVLDTSDRRTGVEAANCFSLALGLLGNDRCRPVGENELGEVNYSSSEGENTRIVRYHLSSVRDILTFQGKVDTGLASIAHQYDPALLGPVIHLASDMYNSRHRGRILRFFEAWYAAVRKDLMTAFLLSWICVEMWLTEEMRIHLRGLGVSQKGQSEFLKMDIIRKIAFLRAEVASRNLTQINDLHVPDSESLRSAESLRKRRNKVVHAGRSPANDDVDSCRILANRSMWRYFNLSGIKYQEYLDEANSILRRRGSSDPLEH